MDPVAAEVVRTQDEIDAAAMRAQKASFEAEDAGGHDEAADAIYTFWQWLTGNGDTDPTEGMDAPL
jgi:hypothetical protein